MKILDTTLPDVKIIQPAVFKDDRGYFFESWQHDKFNQSIPGFNFLQDNESCSSTGTLRGIHLQIKHPQGKLVRVVSGKVFDVAVDLRPDSSTCGQWFGKVLDSVHKEMMWIPPGFGHAFYTLADDTVFVYKCTDVYYHDDQHTLAWNDPGVNINWPESNDGAQPSLSEKDNEGNSLSEIVARIKATV